MTEDAIKFLQAHNPNGPWIVNAISPAENVPPVNISSFNIEDIRAFIDEHNGKNNLYYPVNAPDARLNGKKRRRQTWFYCGSHT